MADIGDDEVVDWGVLTRPMSSAHVVPARALSERVAVHAESFDTSHVSSKRANKCSPDQTAGHIFGRHDSVSAATASLRPLGRPLPLEGQCGLLCC